MMLKLFIQSVSVSAFFIPCLVSGSKWQLSVLRDSSENSTARPKLQDPTRHTDVKKKNFQPTNEKHMGYFVTFLTAKKITILLQKTQ